METNEVHGPTYESERVRTRIAKRGADDEMRTADVGGLAFYLRTLKRTPVLERDAEYQCALHFHNAREALAECFQRLPAACRKHVLNGHAGKSSSRNRWPLEQIESCCERLMAYEQTHDDPLVERIVGEVRPLKRDLDRSREALVVGNLRFVSHVARQFLRHDVPFLDLIQEGNVGLMRAVDRFDPTRGFKFATYAFWWIRQAISRAIADKSRLIRLPEHIRRRIRDLHRVRAEMAEELGRGPTAKELAERLETSPERMDALLSLLPEPCPLENFGTERPGGVMAVLDNRDAVSPLEAALQRERQVKLLAALECLTPRERKILTLRFGLDGQRAQTLEAIGHRLGLTREGVRRIQIRALKKIDTPETRDLRRRTAAH